MPGFAVRPFAVPDAAQVAALHARVYPRAPWDSPAECAAYFRELLFRNPWQDPELPSWVAVEDGQVIGFLGVLPRRMRAGGRTLRVAVGCQFMVDPERRASFAAIALLRQYFGGPQDIAIADGANEASRACWQAAGGTASPLHNLHWVRL
ncbi:MAG TPA: GNAT family N-acetyltransferase, partial [Burkholderiales bacterium]|nr:GNAT family N-acetyltransferase [Burkholderiales bacterium]